MLFLESLADRSRETTVAATVAKSGDKTNVIPENGELSADVRVWSVDGGASRRTGGSRLPARRFPGGRGGGGRRRPPAARVDGGFPRALRAGARGSPRSSGFELGAARVGGASDGNFTAAAGIPTLDGLGPMGGNAHARGEFVSLADLPRRAALLAALAAGA